MAKVIFRERSKHQEAAGQFSFVDLHVLILYQYISFTEMLVASKLTLELCLCY